MVKDTASSTVQKQKRTNKWFVVLSICISLVFLYFAVKDVDWDLFQQAILRANLIWVFPLGLLFLLALLLRSLRWQFLMGSRISFTEIFWINAIGYLLTNLYPGRLGDFARSFLVAKRSAFGVIHALSVIFIERIIDLFLLLSISSISILLIPNLPDWFQGATGIAAGASFAVCMAFLIILKKDEQIVRLLPKFLNTEKLRSFFLNASQKTKDGLRLIRSSQQFAKIFLITLAIWFFEALTCIALGMILGLHLEAHQAILLLTSLGISSAVPSTPGYVGVYQFVAVTVLAVFGISRESALAYILLLQLFYYLFTFIVGGIGILKIKIDLSQLRSFSSS